jgi:Domain of unknown function (DUF1906)
LWIPATNKLMIIDTPTNVTDSLSTLKVAGVDTVIRYFNPLAPLSEKCIKKQEAMAIGAAGIKLGIVCEGFGQPTSRDPLGGISAAAGARDGQWCRNYMATIGAPQNAGLYFACDWDASAAQTANLIVPYFQAIHPFFTDGFYRVGVYGSGFVCLSLRNKSLVSLYWLSGSTGWNGYQMWKPSASLIQDKEDTELAGIPCDTDIAQGDFGAFAPV